MTKYIVSWHYNGKQFLATYDSLTAAQLMRMSLMDDKLKINEVEIKKYEN